MFQDLTEAHITEIKSTPMKYHSNIRASRNALIEGRLNALLQGYNSYDGYYHDIVDDFLQKKELFSKVLCEECGSEVEQNRRKCQSCESHMLSVPKEPEYPEPTLKTHPYQHFALKPKQNNIEIIVGDPDSLNPNSHDNITSILKSLGEKSGITKYSKNGTRKWLYVENDCGILLPVFKLIHNLYRCPGCSLSFYGQDICLSHMSECTKVTNEAVPPEREFNWLVPQTGLFHLEYNSSKAFIKLTWDIFMKEICMCFGFNSEKALKYAKAASDHHKMWDILEATYIALTDELLTPYIRLFS